MRTDENQSTAFVGERTLGKRLASRLWLPIVNRTSLLRLSKFSAVLGISILVVTVALAAADESKSNVKGKAFSNRSDTGTDLKTVQDESEKRDLKKSVSKQKDKIVKTQAEWRKVLSPEEFRVTRLKATERPFSGKYWNYKKPGNYACVCCGEEIYSSFEKFDSGTGWPSFWAPISERAIGTKLDRSLNIVRVEVHCERCGAHLGHVFDDGPEPTGMRHCINSVALKFVPTESPKSK